MNKNFWVTVIIFGLLLSIGAAADVIKRISGDAKLTDELATSNIDVSDQAIVNAGVTAKEKAYILASLEEFNTEVEKINAGRNITIILKATVALKQLK